MRGFFLISTAIAIAISGYSRKSVLPLLARHGGSELPIPATVAAPTENRNGEPSDLITALDGYEREPTLEHAAVVWEQFTAVDSQLKSLKELVSHYAGGARAEAEINRLELQRLRDEQMSRFAGVQRRLNSALAAFNALSSSVRAGEGIQDAAASLVHGRVRGETGEPVRAN
jgi:hypothetical protein